MLSLEEPYQPTGELARYHLRSAISHLLQHPPVQGKAALERIWAEIRSESFQITTEEAIDRFKHGPLVRARHSLIRSIIIGLTKSLLLEERPNIERGRQFAALLSKEHFICAANAFLDNNQLYGSAGTIDVIEEVFFCSEKYQEETKEIWSRIYERIGIWGMWRYNMDSTQRDGHTLFSLIEQRYPDVLKLVNDEAKQRLLGFW